MFGDYPDGPHLFGWALLSQPEWKDSFLGPPIKAQPRGFFDFSLGRYYADSSVELCKLLNYRSDRWLILC
jgi:hypothetical protein